MKILLATVMVLAGVALFGQEEETKTSEYNPKTLLGNKDKSVRGFISFNEKGVILNNQIGMMSGGELNLVFGHRLNFGFFAFGKTNRVQSDYVDVNGYRHFYEMGVAGMKIERVFFTNSAIHFTVPVNFGVGGLTLNRYSVTDYESYDDWDPWGNSLHDFDTFVFVEPGLNLELNLFKHLRLNAGVGYMFTDEIRLGGTNSRPLNNFTGNVSLRLGWF